MSVGLGCVEPGRVTSAPPKLYQDHHHHHQPPQYQHQISEPAQSSLANPASLTNNNNVSSVDFEGMCIAGSIQESASLLC